MEFSELFGAVGILKESIKLLPKNGKLMALLALLYIALSSIFLWIFSISAKSVLLDMLVKETSSPISSSNSSENITVLAASIKKDMGLFLIIYVIFLLAYFIISFFSVISTILVSAVSYTDKTMFFKNLILIVVKSWIRPLITGFYTMLLTFGYFSFVFSMATPLFMYYATSRLSIVILIVVVAYVVYLYLSVVWVLAIVISVIEEDCCGIEALGKAGGLVKGKRFHGFVLNVLFNLVALIIFQGYRVVTGHGWRINPIAILIVTLSLSCLVKIFQCVAFTVFYFHCKKNHGEEIELQGSFDSVEYSKISATLLINDVSEKV